MMVPDNTFSEVLIGSGILFQNSDQECKLTQFFKELDYNLQHYTPDEMYTIFLAILNTEKTVCFLSDNTFWSVTNSAIPIITGYLDHKQLLNGVYLLQLKRMEIENWYNVKSIKEAINSYDMSKFVNVTDEITLLRALYNYNSPKTKQWDVYFSIRSYLEQLTTTDLSVSELKATLLSMPFTDYQRVSKVKSVLYRHLLNKYFLYCKTLEHTYYSYYYMQIDIKSSHFVRMVDTKNKIDSEYNLTVPDLKEYIRNITAPFNSVYKSLLVYQTPLSVPSVDVVTNNLTISSVTLFNTINTTIKTLSHADFTKEYILFPYEALLSLLNSIENQKIIEGLEYDKVKSTESSTSDTNTLNNITSSIDTVVTNLETNPIDPDTGLPTGVTEDDLIKILDDLEIYKDTTNSLLDSSTSGSTYLYYSETDNKQNILVSNVDYLRSLNEKLLGYQSYFNSLINSTTPFYSNMGGLLARLSAALMGFIGLQSIDIKALLSKVSDYLKTFNDGLCQLRALACFFSSLLASMQATYDKLLLDAAQMFDGYKKTVLKQVEVYQKLLDSFKTNVDSSLLEQAKAIVEPKLAPSSLTNPTYVNEVLNAISLAIEDAAQGTGSISGKLDTIGSDIKTASITKAKDALDAVKKISDLNSCKVSPLFQIPNLLNLDLDELNLSFDLLGSLDFNLRSCKE